MKKIYGFKRERAMWYFTQNSCEKTSLGKICLGKRKTREYKVRTRVPLPNAR